jgi:hypothetical protein
MALLILDPALGGDGWSAPHPSRCTPGIDPVLIVQEAGLEESTFKKLKQTLGENYIEFS